MGIRFPNESDEYRKSRDELLRAERELRDHVERVAAQRRSLPLGGKVREDYVFHDRERPWRLSELFETKKTLLVYSYMFGPKMERPCPSCTSLIDGYDATVPHLTQRIAFAVVATSPIARIEEFARARGWKNVHLLSCAGTSYARDYHAEDEKGGQQPMMNTFVKRDGAVHHTWGSELLYARAPGQDPRHVDLVWPLWNLMDFTPEGRGDFYPSLAYR
jgi:predicted dithiol-disulfide oxidoreductase (DUF899 family)